VAITGIEDPLRPTVREAVAECHKASVTIKVYTRDNILTARSIATQCGIYTAGGIIMEGPFFEGLSITQARQNRAHLQGLARYQGGFYSIGIQRNYVFRAFLRGFGGYILLRIDPSLNLSP